MSEASGTVVSSDTGTSPDAAQTPRLSLLMLLTAVAALAAMSRSVAGPFLYDDIALIEGNHYVHSFEHWGRWLSGELWDTNFDVSVFRNYRSFWRPLILGSYAWDWAWGGGSPFSFHVTNLLVHAGNTALLFLLLTGWVRGRLGPLIGALLFAVHPVQTETVCWIAGRTDSLCLLGMLLATWGLRLQRKGMRPAPVLVILIGAVTAILAKEAAIVLPAIVGMELWSWRKAELNLRECGRLLKGTVPALAVSVLYFLGHALLLKNHSTISPPLGVHALSVLEAFGRYGALLLWPNDLSMGRAAMVMDRGSVIPSIPYALGGLAFLALCAAGVAVLRRRLPLAALGLLAFLAMLLPVSSIVWLGETALIAPRFLYIPMVGLSAVLAACVARYAQRDCGRVVGLGLGTLLVIFGLVSGQRAGDYAVADRFWRVELQGNPNFEHAQRYYIGRELQKGRPRRALRLTHKYFQALGAEANEAARARLIIPMLGALLQATPDAKVEDLREIGRFAREIAEGRSSTLVLPEHGLRLHLGGRKGARFTAKDAQRRLDLAAAEAAARSGDEAEAIAALDRALKGCDRCWTLLTRAAVVAAQAGQLERGLVWAREAQALAPAGRADEALRTLTATQGIALALERAPNSRLLRVQYFSALGAFGRAYREAAPVIAQPPPQVAVLEQLARLCVLAGDLDAARRLLLQAGAPVDATVERWLATAIWSEKAHSPEDDWLSL